MKLCEHCRTPITSGANTRRRFCTDQCKADATEEARLDAKRPTGPTTMAHIDAALERARAQQRAS